MMHILYSSFYAGKLNMDCVLTKVTPDIVIQIIYFLIIIIINAKLSQIEVQKISTLCTKIFDLVNNTKLKL